MKNISLHLISPVLVLLILLGGATALKAQETASTKTQPTIAVLGTTSELSDLCALVEAGLFRKGIVLVERAKIDSILNEQKLTAAGLIERDNLLKLGQLIRADGFLLISVEENSETKENPSQKVLPLLRIRLVDTAHGIRFLDTLEEWDSKKLKEIAERITGNVATISPKLTLPPDEAIPIGIVGIHRVELDERYQWLTRALPIMLSARLNKEPRIIMLEREDLKTLLDEKLLTQGKDSKFWNSTVLIDGYLRREGKEDIKLQLQMRDFSGEERGQFTGLVNTEESLKIIDEVVSNIIQRLSNTSSKIVWSPKKEAEEFFRKGDLLKKHGRHKDAIEPLEAAYALQSENILYTGALFENEWNTRVIQGSWPKETGISYYSDLELAELVYRLIRQINKGYEDGSLPASEVFKWEELIGKGGVLKRGYLVNSASASTQEVRDVNRESRRIWIDTLRKVIKENAADDRQSDYVYENIAYISSDNADELMQNFKKTVNELIMPPGKGGKYKSFDKRYDCCRSILTLIPHLWGPHALSEESQLRDQSEKFKELWIEYVKELSETEDPLVRFSGCVSLGQILERGSLEAREYCLEAIDTLLTELKSPNEPLSGWYKEEIRSQMKDCIRLAGFTHDKELDIFERIYEPLMENKDCLNLALWGPHYVSCHQSLFSRTEEEERRYVKLLGEIVAVLEDCKDNSRVFKTLTGIRDYLSRVRKKFPELEPVNKPLPFQVAVLLSNEHWPSGNRFFDYSRVILKDNMLWVAFAESYEEPIIGLAGINLEKKELTSLWHTKLSDRSIEFPCFSYPLAPLLSTINGIAISEDVSYVAVWGIGVIKFPGSSVPGMKYFANPEIITEKDGLPSISITSMAGDKDKLWIAYGGTEKRSRFNRVYDTPYGVAEKDSGLGVYTPKTGHWNAILCSTLRTDDNPFNSGKPYMIFDLAFSPKRDKLFFIVGTQASETAKKSDEMDEYRGLWKIDVNTKKPRFLWYGQKLPGYPKTLALGYLFDSGDKWWLKGLYSLIEVNPDSEKMRIVLGYEKLYREGRNPQPELEIDHSFSEKKIPIGFLMTSLGTGNVDCRCSAIYNDRFWGRLGETQLITIHKDGKGMEDAQIIDNNILNGEKVLYFFSAPYGLIAIGNGVVGLVETESIDIKNE